MAPCGCPEGNCNEQLKEIKIPSDLADSFKRKARPNTQRRIETGGLLLGTDQGDHFCLSTVLLPRQRGNFTPKLLFKLIILGDILLAFICVFMA